MEKKIGVCNNPDCDLCLSREHQEIEFGEEFVCRECGKPLKEFEEKKKKKSGKKLPIIIIAAILIIGGIVAAIFALRDKSEPTPPEEPVVVECDTVNNEEESINNEEEFINNEEEGVIEDTLTIVEDTLAVEPDEVDSIPVETVEQPQPVAKQPQEQPVKPQVSKLDLGYATYEPMEGASGIKNGKPHGNGIMRFKSRQTIPGTEDCVAEPGEWVNGMWRDGKVNAGTWYRNDGNQVIVKLGQRYNK